jgi:hypothetical protein
MFSFDQPTSGQDLNLHVAHSASAGALAEDGSFPEGVLELGTYPEGSGVNYTIETFWTRLDDAAAHGTPITLLDDSEQQPPPTQCLARVA